MCELTLSQQLIKECDVIIHLRKQRIITAKSDFMCVLIYVCL